MTIQRNPICPACGQSTVPLRGYDTLADRNQAIKDWIERGESYAQIASRLCISRQRLDQIAKKHGFPQPRAQRSHYDVAEAKARYRQRVENDRKARLERWERLVERVKRGESIYAVAKTEGVDQGVLGKHVKKAGFRSEHGWQAARRREAVAI